MRTFLIIVVSVCADAARLGEDSLSNRTVLHVFQNGSADVERAYEELFVLCGCTHFRVWRRHFSKLTAILKERES